MARIAKLIARALRKPPDLRFSEVRRILEHFGYKEDRQSGSHVVFTKKGEYPISVPLIGGKKVKRTYILEIIDLLGLEEYDE